MTTAATYAPRHQTDARSVQLIDNRQSERWTVHGPTLMACLTRLSIELGHPSPSGITSRTERALSAAGQLVTIRHNPSARRWEITGPTLQGCYERLCIELGYPVANNAPVSGGTTEPTPLERITVGSATTSKPRRQISAKARRAMVAGARKAAALRQAAKLKTAGKAMHA